MKTSIKFIIITFLLGTPAFILGRVIWPDVPGSSALSGIQLPLFMFISALESALFGFGLAFLAFGWPYVKKIVPQGKKDAMWVFLSVAWLMVSWWPHDNMHRANGMDMVGLIKIEYEFHFTLIIASLVVANHFWKFLKRNENSVV